MTTAVSNTAKRSSANTLFGQAVAVPLRLEPGKTDRPSSAVGVTIGDVRPVGVAGDLGLPHLT
jgi:hypothetical protein